MKLKIHNKKGFWGGAFLLLLAVFYIPTLMNNITDMDTTMRIGKTILIITACALFGVTGVYRGINSKCAKEDAQEDDERKKLVDILSLIHISEPTRLGMISYAVFCLK